MCSEAEVITLPNSSWPPLELLGISRGTHLLPESQGAPVELGCASGPPAKTPWKRSVRVTGAGHGLGDDFFLLGHGEREGSERRGVGGTNPRLPSSPQTRRTSRTRRAPGCRWGRRASCCARPPPSPLPTSSGTKTTSGKSLGDPGGWGGGTRTPSTGSFDFCKMLEAERAGGGMHRRAGASPGRFWSPSVRAGRASLLRTPPGLGLTVNPCLGKRDSRKRYRQREAEQLGADGNSHLYNAWCRAEGQRQPMSLGRAGEM